MTALVCLLVALVSARAGESFAAVPLGVAVNEARRALGGGAGVASWWLTVSPPPASATVEAAARPTLALRAWSAAAA